ncbi:MAG TPA: hypothetical protein VLL08_15590 [Kineosporiaceae bacterium]|nr:hypothetical protein [Kineosporiaceae bacterium]
MSDTEDQTQDMSEPVRNALVELVIRGMYRGEPSAAQAALVERGLALVKGPLLMPTLQAAALAGSLVRTPAGGDVEARVRRLLEAFLPINRTLRELCTAWQIRPDGSVNDHSDAMYDAGVRDRLDDVHDSTVPVLDRLTAVLPSIGEYAPRLQAALDRLDSGETAWLASPLLESYHTVWMHLHQELLMRLGMTRKEDEELEAALVAGQAALVPRQAG